MRLIDADALKKLFPDNGEGSWTYNITARMYIDNAPTIEWTDIELMGYINGEQITKIKPAKIEGHWMKNREDNLLWAECSLCHYNEEVYDYAKNHFHYCPNCGAKMKRH